MVKKGGFGYGKDGIWRELRVTNVLLKTFRRAGIDKCVIGKRNSPESMIRCNLVWGIAFDFQVVLMS